MAVSLEKRVELDTGLLGVVGPVIQSSPVIPSEARDLLLCDRRKKSRSLASLGMTSLG